MKRIELRYLSLLAALVSVAMPAAASAEPRAATASGSRGAPSCDARPSIKTTGDGVEFVRTPGSCFDDLPGWPYKSRHVVIDGLRQAYVDEGRADGDVVLLLHGQPSWSYLYRKMIPELVDAGYRVIAMDHLGMGRSDKPIDIESFSYLGHFDRLKRFIDELRLTGINLFVQDWGSLIGLRVAGLHPGRFATIAVGNGALPVIPAGIQPFPSVENPDQLTDLPAPYAAIPPQQPPFYDGCTPILAPPSGYFADWMAHAMTARSFRASETVEALTWFDVPASQQTAYDAPFPSRTYMAGARVFPSLVNEVPGTNARAWAGLTAFNKPFLTIWASNDPGQLGSCQAQQVFIDSVPGAAGQPHTRLPEASHFLQDDQGEQIAQRLLRWYVAGTATAKRTQRQKGKKIVVEVKVRAKEDLEAEASGKVRINPTYRLETETKSVGEGKKKTLKLRPKKRRHAKKIAKALKRGKKAKAKLRVKLTDEAGNSKGKRLKVKLKR